MNTLITSNVNLYRLYHIITRNHENGIKGCSSTSKNINLTTAVLTTVILTMMICLLRQFAYCRFA